MNKDRNLEIVNEYGDQIQLTFGTEFGYFASQIDFELILDFLFEFNSNNWIKSNGYQLALISNENFYKIGFINNSINFKSTATLLDHTVFVDAKEEDWKKLHTQAFSLLTATWRKFLAKHIRGYREHFNNSCILKTEHLNYSI